MSVTLRGLFERITGGQNTVSRQNVRRFLEKAGVGGGILGGTKLNLATDAFFDKLRAPEGSLTWEQFRQRGAGLLPPGLATGGTADTVSKEIDRIYDTLDPRDQGLTADDLKAHIERMISAKGGSFAGQKAEGAAKVLLYALDDTGDERLQRQELKAFALDVLREAIAA